MHYDTCIIGGCSFSHDYNGKRPTWATYLKNLAQFDRMIDCSCPGAGNRHIHDSVMFALENDVCISENHKVLVVIMWSGYDRDDFLVAPGALKTPYPDHYQYMPGVHLGMSGGLCGESNLVVGIDNVKKIKDCRSRSIENYLLITGLYHYLQDRGLDFVMTEFHTPGTLDGYLNFDPGVYLPEVLAHKFAAMVRHLRPNLGDFALAIGDRNHHPCALTHERWTKEVLIPYMMSQEISPESVKTL